MERSVLEIGEEHKDYESPAVVYELSLEVRAGSPFAMPEGVEELFLGQ